MEGLECQIGSPSGVQSRECKVYTEDPWALQHAKKVTQGHLITTKMTERKWGDVKRADPIPETEGTDRSPRRSSVIAVFGLRRGNPRMSH